MNMKVRIVCAHLLGGHLTSHIQAHLLSFLRECAQRNANGFHAIVDRLNVEEILVVRRAVEGH